jgi:hypothetical protein
MRPKQVDVQHGPERPSHYGEDNNEFLPYDNTDKDFATQEDAAALEEQKFGFPKLIAPTPVYLVEPAPNARTLKRWHTETVTVDNTATSVNANRTQIASNDRHRTRLIVQNLDAANSVFLTPNPMNNNQSFAYELAAGKREEFFHNAGMWAFCAATKSAKIAIFGEIEVDEL